MITFQCFECGEEMEISRKMAGKPVRCVKCGAVAEVPKPRERRQHTEEEQALLHRIKQKVDRDEQEKEKTDAENAQFVLPKIGWFGSPDAGMIGGSIMIVVAVVWFVWGLSVDRFFYYPPVLLVVGIVAIVRGIIIRVRGSKRRKRKR
jgi:hypothetical protein